MKLKLFVFLGIFSLLLVSFSAVLLVTKNVSGFDMFGSKKVDCVPYNVFLERGEKDYSVKILWLTKAKCFGFVQYGMDSKDIDMIGVGSNSKAKEHSVIIEKISPSEKYFFLINSDDQTYGNGGVPLEFVLNNL